MKELKIRFVNRTLQATLNGQYYGQEDIDYLRNMGIGNTEFSKKIGTKIIKKAIGKISEMEIYDFNSGKWGKNQLMQEQHNRSGEVNPPVFVFSGTI